ncbi:MAG: hypothetical protein V1775_12355 [Bacteroidota bacterium]
MKRLLILIIPLIHAATGILAQQTGIEAFADAVPYNLKSPENIYLTNQDAEAVKTFYTQSGRVQPDRIVRVEEGYYHGYRLCYNISNCNGRELPARWIQVVTVDIPECIEWFEEHNPELLMAPFVGLRELTGKYGSSKTDFFNLYDQYKFLACRLYRQSEDHEGEDTNELALVIHRFTDKISLETSQMLASGGEGVMLKPGNSNQNEWDLWMQCFGELEVIGYSSLIEYSDPPVSGMLW